ncbi:hypothetical protein RYX36_020622, partial [Vicia faba]
MESNNSPLNHTKLVHPNNNHDHEQNTTLEIESDKFDYSKRSQWLRAAVLGANDGLVSTASLMMGVGANNGNNIEEVVIEKESLPNPLQAAAASALAFSIGAMVPLLAASFIKDYKLRVGVVLVAVSFALVVFGLLGAVLGKAPVLKSCLRVLLGGWIAMAITFGLTKLIGS